MCGSTTAGKDRALSLPVSSIVAFEQPPAQARASLAETAAPSYTSETWERTQSRKPPGPGCLVGLCALRRVGAKPQPSSETIEFAWRVALASGFGLGQFCGLCFCFFSFLFFFFKGAFFPELAKRVPSSGVTFSPFTRAGGCLRGSLPPPAMRELPFWPIGVWAES